VFISKTRQGEKKIEELKCRLGLKYYISHAGKEKCVGIALFWDEQVEIKVLSESLRYFDVCGDPTYHCML
jgi:hypothetical protein